MRRRHALSLLSSPLLAADWPQFRGPSGQGFSQEKGLPFEWSETKNIKWKAAIPGAGWSSPSIAGDRIWLTTSTERGASLRVVAVDAATGKIALDKEVIRINDKGPGIHGKNSFASPTAIVGGDRVYLHFGFYGTACVKTNGDLLWKTTLKYEPQHGPG